MAPTTGRAYYCCCCDSGTATAAGNTVILLGSLFSLIVVASTWISTDPPSDQQERTYLNALLVFHLVMITCCFIALCGVCAKRRSLAKGTFYIVNIIMALEILFFIINPVFYPFNLVFILGVIFGQGYFFWVPMYAYLYKEEDEEEEYVSASQIKGPGFEYPFGPYKNVNTQDTIQPEQMELLAVTC